MKIKWVELKEDDPIFKGGFVISYPNIRKLKKIIKNEKREKGDKTYRQKKEKGVNPLLLY